jgi:hypothetical protein
MRGGMRYGAAFVARFTIYDYVQIKQALDSIAQYEWAKREYSFFVE